MLLSNQKEVLENHGEKKGKAESSLTQIDKDFLCIDAETIN